MFAKSDNKFVHFGSFQSKQAWIETRETKVSSRWEHINIMAIINFRQSRVDYSGRLENIV